MLSWCVRVCFAALLTSCVRNRDAPVETVLLCCCQGENIDIKALRARFNNQSSTSQTSSRDSGSPKSPRPGFGRASLPMTENNMAHHRVSPTAPFLPMAGVGLVRFPRAEPLGTPRPVFSPRMPPNPGLRPGIQGTDTYRVRPTGEMQQNIMQRQQRPPVPRPLAASALAPAPAPGPGPALVPVPVPVPVPAPATTSTPLPLQQQPRQRSTGDVTPLRRPLPPEGPLPLKPKRPPNVNLEPYVRFRRGPALPEPRKRNSESLKLIHSHIFSRTQAINVNNPDTSLNCLVKAQWLNICYKAAYFPPHSQGLFCVKIINLAQSSHWLMCEQNETLKHKQHLFLPRRALSLFHRGHFRRTDRVTTGVEFFKDD